MNEEEKGVAMITINEATAQNLTIQGLQAWANSLPAAQRTRPIISFDMRSWSIPQMVGQVQSLTDVGRRYAHFYIQSLKKYVISG